MVTRHELLQRLHGRKMPEVYLETGVQHGWSINLAIHSRVAIGIDPEPLIPQTGNVALFRQKSDDFFAEQPEDTTIFGKIDMAFIDGMHLVEYALRDFINIERRARHDAIIIFDDVLPRNETEANRVQCPGDWTGDVWKIYEILSNHRPDLTLNLCDTFPTGTLIVSDLDPTNRALAQEYDNFIGAWERDLPVPALYLTRSFARGPEEFDTMLEDLIHMEGKNSS